MLHVEGTRIRLDYQSLFTKNCPRFLLWDERNVAWKGVRVSLAQCPPCCEEQEGVLANHDGDGDEKVAKQKV